MRMSRNECIEECRDQYRDVYQKYAEEMLDFIEKSPTCFHAVANIKTTLEEQGFQELKEAEEWSVEPGKGYYVTRNGSSLIAFRMPGVNDAAEGASESVKAEALDKSSSAAGEGECAAGSFSCADNAYDEKGDRKTDTFVAEKTSASGDKTGIKWGDRTVIEGFHITAAHSDSPAFKIKESPEMTVENVYVKLNTEKYGGMNLTTWFDRALSVAGRVAVNGEEGVVTKLVNIDKDLLVIPSVAVHLTRSSSKEEYNPQVDLLPLYAERDCWREEQELFSKEEQEDEEDGQNSHERNEGQNLLMKRVADEAGVAPEEILGHDLFLYTREKGRILGENGEFVLSPRLDDLQCVYISARGFLEGMPMCHINVCAIFDNEEVGSGTKQGANSTFLEDVLWRICECMGLGRSQYLRMIAGSFLISADNAHAVHPNHPEKSDPTNRPYLNRGMVIKFHGSQKYATDAVSAARMRRLCQDAQAPCQTYANRSDIAGGSTLGNISTSHVSVSSVDVGLPQLAMHSAVETAGVKDTKYAVDIFREFFSR